MIRDITIGQYYPTDSVIHRLDPRVKLLGTLMFIISLFLFNGIIGYVITFFGLAFVITKSKVPFKFMVRGLKAIMILLIFTVVFNLFLQGGEHLVFEWKFIHIYGEGIRTASLMGLRLTYMIIGSSLMTLTTTPNQLTDAIESVLGPFKKLHVPAHEIAMMMSIALRFIPILLEETDKIMKAQQARGASFDEGNIFQRVKSMVPILVPLFISAFRRANDLAMAMEARCYHGGEGRTRMKPLKYGKRDVWAYTICIFYVVALVAVDKTVAHFVPIWWI